MKTIGMWTLALCMSVGTIGLVGCGDTTDETTTPAPATGGADTGTDTGVDTGVDTGADTGAADDKMTGEGAE